MTTLALTHAAPRANIVARHPFAAFLVLAFPLSWAIVPLTGGAAINPAGPLIAALVVSALVGGRAEVRGWLRRSFSPRGALRWHAAAIGAIVGLYAAASLAAFALGAARPSASELGAWTEILFVFPLYLLLIAAPEESGWRGFAFAGLVPRFGTLGATAVLAVVIAAWHTPLVFAGEQAVAVLVAIAASQFLFTWLQRRSGSVPVVMVAHAAQGGIAGAYLGPMFTGSDQTLQVTIWAGLLALVAVGLALRSRRS